jgi:hypothetical protein
MAQIAPEFVFGNPDTVHPNVTDFICSGVSRWKLDALVRQLRATAPWCSQVEIHCILLLTKMAHNFATQDVPLPGNIDLEYIFSKCAEIVSRDLSFDWTDDMDTVHKMAVRSATWRILCEEINLPYIPDPLPAVDAAVEPPFSIDQAYDMLQESMKTIMDEVDDEVNNSDDDNSDDEVDDDDDDDDDSECDLETMDPSFDRDYYLWESDGDLSADDACRGEAVEDSDGLEVVSSTDSFASDTSTDEQPDEQPDPVSTPILPVPSSSSPSSPGGPRPPAYPPQFLTTFPENYRREFWEKMSATKQDIWRRICSGRNTIEPVQSTATGTATESATGTATESATGTATESATATATESAATPTSVVAFVTEYGSASSDEDEEVDALEVAMGLPCASQYSAP